MGFRKALFIGGGALLGAKVGREIGKQHQEKMLKMSPEELSLYKAGQKKTLKTAGTIFKWYFIGMLIFMVILLLMYAVTGEIK